MPRHLKRYQQTGELHFITFSCFHRRAFLRGAAARDAFLRILEQTRERFAFVVLGYVVMPEHVHLLVSEPFRGRLATALQVLKQNSARQLQQERFAEYQAGRHFWQKRYYDFNVRTEKKRIEKLKYMHRNPVQRGLVAHPEDWRWSSYRTYAFAEAGLTRLNTWPELTVALTGP